VSKLAQIISKMEGFGIPGAIPTIRHNPGDLRHAPHASHEGEGSNDIGIEDSDADGWADLERQLQLYAARGMSLRQMVAEYAPSNENDTARYLAFLCVGLFADTPVAEALKIP